MTNTVGRAEAFFLKSFSGRRYAAPFVRPVNTKRALGLQGGLGKSLPEKGPPLRVDRSAPRSTTQAEHGAEVLT